MLATTSVAQAQTWLSDRTRAAGIGIRVGDLELHPGIGAEFGYTTNVYNAEEDAELASAALRVSPHLFLSTLTGERAGFDEEETAGIVEFNGGLSASLQHYFADAAPGTDFGTNLSLQLTLAPRRPVSFMITELFSRSFLPFADPVDDPSVGPVDPEANAPNVDFVRYHESIGARLMGETRGGLLQGSLGYRLAYDWYDDDAYAANNSLAHTVDLRGAWEFLPRSALFYEAAYTHQNYTNNDGAGDPEPGLTLRDNDQISAQLGFNGAITSRISATVAGGYAAGFFGGDDYEGVILNAEGRWTPSAISEWAIGFERAFSSAYQGNFVRQHQIYTRLRMFFGGAFVLTSKLAVEFLDFGPSSGIDEQEARSDIRYSGDLSGEYRFVDWLAVTGQLSAVRDDSDYIARATVRVGGEDRVLEDPVEYTTFEAWFGLRAFY